MYFYDKANREQSNPASTLETNCLTNGHEWMSTPVRQPLFSSLTQSDRWRNRGGEVCPRWLFAESTTTSRSKHVSFHVRSTTPSFNNITCLSHVRCHTNIPRTITSCVVPGNKIPGTSTYFHTTCKTTFAHAHRSHNVALTWTEIVCGHGGGVGV